MASVERQMVERQLPCRRQVLRRSLHHHRRQEQVEAITKRFFQRTKWIVIIEIQIQWGSEFPTSLVFIWSKPL